MQKLKRRRSRRRIGNDKRFAAKIVFVRRNFGKISCVIVGRNFVKIIFRFFVNISGNAVLQREFEIFAVSIDAMFDDSTIFLFMIKSADQQLRKSKILKIE
jgi:hypothetical protein